ncbi:MAG: fumarylacetoacetate hydrolase family protein [Caulobacteraceae bacterium]
MTDPSKAAQYILDQRRAGHRFQPATRWAGPGFDLAAAYDVQDRYVALLKAECGQDVAGYKIGLTSPRMQAMCGVDQPIAGVVLASRLQSSPGRAKVSDHIRLAIECEIAVRLGRDPPGGGLALARDEVDVLIDRACAAFEIVDDAQADYATLDAPSIVADNSWNAGLLLGPDQPYDGGGLTGRQGVLYRNGEELDRGCSDDVLGDPLNVIAWLAGHLAARGQGLKAGDWVTTGSIVTSKFVQPGEAYEFRVDGLEPVLFGVG